MGSIAVRKVVNQPIWFGIRRAAGAGTSFHIQRGAILSIASKVDTTVTSQPSLATNKLALTAVIASLIAHLPYVYVQTLNTLARPHYHFLFLVPIVLIADVRRRLTKPVEFKGVIDWKTGFLFGGQVFLDAAAVAFRSPWIGMVAAIWLLLLLAYYWGGKKFVRQLLPVWVCMWLFLPLPFGMDEVLITSLRNTATRMAGSVLDVLGIMHVVEVNLIVLPERVLFVADACSGIHSLFVLLGSALLLGVWLRRPIANTILLIGSSFLIVMLENVARLALVALASSAGWNWSEGWRHETLGFVLFGISLGLLWSFDRLFLFLLPNGLYLPWKSRSNKKRGKGSQDRSRVSPVTSAEPPRRMKRTAIPQIVIVASIATLGLQFSRLPGAISSIERVVPPKIELPEFGAEALPESFGGLNQTKYAFIKRVEGDPMGEVSQQWRYKNDRLTVLISLDYPYTGPHDLCECYQQTGWNLDAAKVVGEGDESNVTTRSPTAFAIADLSRPYFGDSVLLFSSGDFYGNNGCRLKLLEVPDVGASVDDKMKRWVNDLDAAPDDFVDTDPRWFQVQVHAFSVDQLTDEDVEQLKQMFVEARKTLYAKCRAEEQR